jgi:hypothetical protein
MGRFALKWLGIWIALVAMLAVAVSPSRADVIADLQSRQGQLTYAAGLVKFHAAIERLGQGFYRHGLEPPDTTNMAGLMPLFRLNVPVNPVPETIDYQKFRAILAQYVEDMDAAEATLAAAGVSDVKVPVDLAQVSFDFNADGKRTPEESFAAMLVVFLPVPAEGANSTLPQSMLVHFDTADVHWLRGYGRLTSAFAQFFLAHDFEAMFNKTFHRVFPKAGLTRGEALRRAETGHSVMTGRADSEHRIADVIAAFHMISWSTVEPNRLADVRERLKAVAQLSPQSWKAARAETDNDREWMPNEKQVQAITGSTNTAAQIDGWIQVMTEFELVLDGKKLMPHWRFDKGLNVKKFFDTSEHFDLVLMILGTDAVKYVEDGEISTSTRWRELMQAFDGNFLGYALWYN